MAHAVCELLLEHSGLSVSPRIVLDEVERDYTNPEGTGYKILMWPRNV